MHSLLALQSALVVALKGDAALAAIVGEGVFDAAPKGWAGAMVVIARHDVAPVDADLAPGQEHRVVLHCRADQPSRRRVVEMVEQVVAVAVGLAVPDLVVSRREHVRTETMMDERTGLARAVVVLRFASEAG